MRTNTATGFPDDDGEEEEEIHAMWTGGQPAFGRQDSGLDGSSADSKHEPRTPVARPGPPGYEIIGESSRDGLAVEFRARHVRLDRLVTLRARVPLSVTDLGSMVWWHREIGIRARLNHPHIVPLLDCVEHEGQPWMVLEWFDGGALDLRIRGTPQPLRPTVTLVERVALTLSYLHASGVIHSNLKPGNILLATPVTPRPGVPADALSTEEHYGTPLLGSLELALDRQAAAELNENTRVGTPPYMAPEQAAGRHQELGPARDIFGLGIILYELLTGRWPFKGNSTAELLLHICEKDPIPPRALRRRLDPRLDAICRKCLRKDPRERYASAVELAADLREVSEKPRRRFWCW